VEYDQARHQQGQDDGQHTEREAPPGHERQGRLEGQHTHDRCHVRDLVQQQRIDEQRDKGDQRQDLVDIRRAQQPLQPQPAAGGRARSKCAEGAHVNPLSALLAHRRTDGMGAGGTHC
jgi:hypothetical protein